MDDILIYAETQDKLRKKAQLVDRKFAKSDLTENENKRVDCMQKFKFNGLMKKGIRLTLAKLKLSKKRRVLQTKPR